MPELALRFLLYCPTVPTKATFSVQFRVLYFLSSFLSQLESK